MVPPKEMQQGLKGLPDPCYLFPVNPALLPESPLSPHATGCSAPPGSSIFPSQDKRRAAARVMQAAKFPVFKAKLNSCQQSQR